MSDHVLEVASRHQLNHALDGRASLPAPFSDHMHLIKAIIRTGDKSPSLSIAEREAGHPAGMLPGEMGGAEAIIQLFNRPAMAIRRGRIMPPANDEWKRRLSIFRPIIEPALGSVGRIRLKNGPAEWIGTAWIIGKNLAVTNRHLATEFATNAENRFQFLRASFGPGLIEASIDFGWELPPSPDTLRVTKVLYIAPRTNHDPDLALLRVEGDVPAPIALGEDAEVDEWVGVVGYPGKDSRNDADAQQEIFGGLYGVKQFAPGQVMKPTGSSRPAPFEFLHDASTLGGNSGSAVLSLRDGRAVGLHFGGLFKKANYAVRASAIKAVLRNARLSSPPGRSGLVPPEAAAADDPVHPADFFAGRKGYDPQFLGQGFPANWPDLGRWATDLAPLQQPGGKGGHKLDYMHFSVIMCRSRRMPLITAVNVDGKKARSLGREADRWFFDGRIARKYQIGNAEAYTHNKLDRGHQVKREDPNWGDDAGIANQDTFHYTNCCPQHSALNQKTWKHLEDFILGTAKARELRACVFTGPVLHDSDFAYRDIRVPSEFFKIVVVVDDEADELEATGFLQSQTDFLREDIDEHVFDQGSTYQVPVAHLERLTGLDFGALKKSDPMQTKEESATDSFPGRRIREARDILRRQG